MKRLKKALSEVVDINPGVVILLFMFGDPPILLMFYALDELNIYKLNFGVFLLLATGGGALLAAFCINFVKTIFRETKKYFPRNVLITKI